MFIVITKTILRITQKQIAQVKTERQKYRKKFNMNKMKEPHFILFFSIETKGLY